MFFETVVLSLYNYLFLNTEREVYYTQPKNNWRKEEAKGTAGFALTIKGEVSALKPESEKKKERRLTDRQLC